MERVTREVNDDGIAQSYGFRGHAAVFNQPALIGSRDFGFIEIIAPDAFRDVLTDDVRFLINHDGLPLARTTNGTLRLSQDNVGQFVDADLAPTREAQDLAVLLERKDIDQMSFAFGLRSEDYTWSTYSSEDNLNGMDVRTINSIYRQYDVSAVTYPAYEGTDAGLRAQIVSEEEVRKALAELRSDQDVVEQMEDARSQHLTVTRRRSLDLHMKGNQ